MLWRGLLFRISFTRPESWHLFNSFSYFLICGHICSTCEVNMLTDFHTSTMKFRRLMEGIVLFLVTVYSVTRHHRTKVSKPEHINSLFRIYWYTL